MTNRPCNALELLATSAHGGMVVLHALGAVYNTLHRNQRWALFHLFALVMSAVGTGRHIRRL